MASYVKAFVAENVAELRRMNARQLVQQIVALGAPLFTLSHRRCSGRYAAAAGLRVWPGGRGSGCDVAWAAQEGLALGSAGVASHAHAPRAQA